MISICEEGGMEVFTLDEAKHMPMSRLRKPVIYLYPKKEQEISVSVEVNNGSICTEYPKRTDGKWNMLATPEGDLTDIATQKKYSYLFWEAERTVPFEIDRKNCFCIAGSEAESFLEEKLSILGLNEREKNDFIVYWLPFLEQNPYSLVAFLEEEYTATAPLTITPEPESLLRVFMIFQSVNAFQETIPQELSPKKRKGYTVVEWGGANLDESLKNMR